MKIGLHIPEQLIGFEPAVLRDYAQEAEDLGFDYLTCVDHVLGTPHEDRTPPFPAEGIYTDKSAFHEPLTLFAFLAGVTTRLELVTTVLVLPQRQTALVAKQAAEIALLSNHRLRLGVGSGWNYVEYESLGSDYRTRARRQEEQVLLLRRLWSEPLLDVESDFHRIDRASINPRLDRPVPIWFGGFSAAQQDRCARIGDGMLWERNTSLSRRGNDTIREKAIALGPDPGSLGFQATISPRTGETLHEVLSTWAQAGGTHATVSPVASQPDPTSRTSNPSGSGLLDVLPRVREEVGDWMGEA
jgi:probable F420-dependent oxidoreductase